MLTLDVSSHTILEDFKTRNLKIALCEMFVWVCEMNILVNPLYLSLLGNWSFRKHKGLKLLVLSLKDKNLETGWFSCQHGVRCLLAHTKCTFYYER